MKLSKQIFLLAFLTLSLASCSDKVKIKGTLKDAPNKQIVVKQLAVNVFNVLDTIKTNTSGDFAYKLSVAKGQPEFVYLFYGDTRVAALLLESGENVSVSADTLGHYEISGSESSEKLAQVESRYSEFLNKFYSLDDSKQMSRLYVEYYRSCLSYVLTNCKSLTAIPVLYQNLNPEAPIFSQMSDALVFRTVADSLKKVYPNSRYVKALDKEAARREQILAFESKVQSAPEQGYPNLNLSSIDGSKISLKDIDAKVKLVHFWTSTNDAQKMFNIDELIKLYNEFHDKGFEIYAVCIDPDKAQWASVVKAQKLPWINVNDGLGLSSPALSIYGISSLPSSLLIVGDDIYSEQIVGVNGLRSELRKLLK